MIASVNPELMCLLDEGVTAMPRIIGTLVCIMLIGCAQSPFRNSGGAAQNIEPRGQSISGGIPFLERLRWGYSEKEVRVAVPQVDEIFERTASPEAPRRSLHLSHVMLGECQFDVRMDFFNSPFDELTRIGASFAGEHLEECISKTRELLTRRFGAHPYSRVAADQEYLAWNGEITTAAFMVNKVGGKKHLFVSLSHTGAPGTFLN
jgi:hypothetical protein